MSTTTTSTTATAAAADADQEEAPAKEHRVPPPKYHDPVQGTVYHGDGREELLLQHLRSEPSLSPTDLRTLSLHDRSARVLSAIHEFGKGEKRYLMSVGETKGRGVEALIRERKPRLVLELGAYVGYSAISFARHLLPLYPSTHVYPSSWSSSADATIDPVHENRVGYISLEKSDVYAQTARAACDLAGVGDVVKFVIGSSTSSLKNLRETLNMPRPLQFDMVFLDHLKPLYTVDLKIMEEEGLVGPGTILVADNVVKPGNPAYLSWVRATPAQKRASLDTPRHKTQPPLPAPQPTTDAGWKAAYREGPIEETRWSPDEADGIVADGNPDLVYEGYMIGGWDPYTQEVDAVEVSTCTGIEKRE